MATINRCIICGLGSKKAAPFICFKHTKQQAAEALAVLPVTKAADANAAAPAKPAFKPVVPVKK